MIFGMIMDEDPLYQLVKEKLDRYRDSFDARLARAESDLNHYIQLNNERVQAIKETIDKDIPDHETRIRDLRDSAIGFKSIQSLFSGGSLVASITALIRSVFGG